MDDYATRSDDPFNPRNADDYVYDYFNAKQRKYVKKVLNKAIIEEYRRCPLGRHSEPLERVLAYFRRLPLQQQYGLKREADGTFRMIAMSGLRGAPPNPASREVFRTVEEGYFGIFLRQIKDMTEA